jgi:hypothetical protein
MAEPSPGPPRGRHPGPRPTPEQFAKTVTDKRPSSWSRTGLEITLRFARPRAVLEWLMARAHRENYPSLAAWVQAVLEREGKG